MNLSLSERRTLIVGGVLLALLLLYGLMWSPVVSNAERWSKVVKEKETFAVWMSSAVQEAQRLRQKTANPKTNGGQSLLALVDQTARRSQLGPALKRVEPKGSDEVRVRLEQASFDDVMKWLSQLQRGNGVSVDSISIDKDDSPGRVSATLTLKGASS